MTLLETLVKMILEALERPVQPSKPFLDNELWILEEARRRGSE